VKANNTLTAEDAVMRDPEVRERTGYCNMQRRRMEAAGTFPKRFKLNPDGGPYGAVGWSRREVMAWIASRRASRQAA
jgi:predicted DNA-binding transcriptional regulator AlpA